MALTELQRPTREEFYGNMRNTGNRLYDSMNNTLERTFEFLSAMDADTLDDMGVPASGADNGLRVDLVNCRTALQELQAFWDGTSTTQTVVPKTAINKIRGM